MLQRQIMFKQLQELQRRQQLQDLGGNQNYVNQLSSLKQASGGQFPPSANGISLHDPSHMFMVGNAQIMQHVGSSGVQGFPNGMLLPQSHHHSLGPAGLAQQQFDLSLYGTSAPNIDKNPTQFSPAQEQSNLSMDLLTKNIDSPLGMLGMQHSALGSPFLSQPGPGNFSSDQITRPDGTLLMNPEKDLFGQVPVHSFNNGAISSRSYSQQGVAMQRNASVPESNERNEDGDWHGNSAGKTLKLGLSDSDACLDPLEQKILYSNDDSIWGSPTVENTSYMDTVPSIQIGSWSALMQSAVAESSTVDTGMQEEWNGLSVQNPEPENQPMNFIEREMPQNNWVQNITSPSSKPMNLFQNSDTNSSFPGFQQLGQQYLNNREEFNSESPHASIQHSPRNMSRSNDYDGQQKHPMGMGGSQLIQTSLPSPGSWPAQHNQHSRNNMHQPGNMPFTNNQSSRNLFGYDLRGNLLVHDNASHPLAVENPKPFNQVNQLNIHRYPLESKKIVPGDDAQHRSAPSGASSDHRGRDITSQSESMLELLNKDDDDHPTGPQVNSKVLTPGELLQAEASDASLAKPSNPVSQDFEFRVGQPDSRIPQSFSFFPPMSTVNSGPVSLPSHNINDYMKPPNSAPQPPSQTGVKFSPYDASQLKTSHSGSPGSPYFENVSVSQPSMTSVASQHVDYPGGLPNPWPDLTTKQDMASPKPHMFPNNIFRPPDSTSNSLDTISGFAQHIHESVKLEYRQNQLDSGNLLPEGSTEINNSTPVIRNSHHLGSSPKVQPAPDAVLSGDIGGSNQSSDQNYSHLHPIHSTKTTESDHSQRFPIRYEGVNFQKAFANARDLFLGGQRSGLNIKTNSDSVSELASVSSGNNKEQNILPEAKASSMADVQNFQQREKLRQNDSRINPISSNDASNATYQSQISLQMAPSWFKHFGTLKNGQMLPMFNPKALAGASQPLSEMNLGSMPEINLIMQSKSSTTGIGSTTWAPSAADLIPSQPTQPSLLPSDMTYQTLSNSMPKKRKMVEIDIVPWNEEINSMSPRLRDISISELEWARASNRKPEEIKGEAEIVEDGMVSVVRAKRRLVFTTQLMQQVFRPPAVVLLRADASSNCNYLPYATARLMLGDACSLNSQLPLDPNDPSLDKPKTAKRKDAVHDFSKTVECLISRVNKLEDDLSRMDKSFSIVDVKVAMQELDKFAMINRFARFHIKAQQIAADPASSTATKPSPQRYVSALPMPKTLPEGIDCLSL